MKTLVAVWKPFLRYLKGMTSRHHSADTCIELIERSIKTLSDTDLFLFGDSYISTMFSKFISNVQNEKLLRLHDQRTKEEWLLLEGKLKSIKLYSVVDDRVYSPRLKFWLERSFRSMNISVVYDSEDFEDSDETSFSLSYGSFKTTDEAFCLILSCFSKDGIFTDKKDALNRYSQDLFAEMCISLSFNDAHFYNDDSINMSDFQYILSECRSSAFEYFHRIEKAVKEDKT